MVNVLLHLFGLPQHRGNLYRSSIAFKTSTKTFSPLDECFGAPDGLAVKITKPREEENSASYCNGKRFYPFAVCIKAMLNLKTCF